MNPKVQVVMSPAVVQLAAAAFAAGAVASPAPGAVVVHVGAAYGSRSWPAERFAEVARALVAQGRTVVLTGSAAERERATGIGTAAGLPEHANLAGRTGLAELAALQDPKIRAVNERHGDDHGVNLGALRAVAKRLKTQHDLARELWATGDTAARLLALLVCRPKAFGRDERFRIDSVERVEKLDETGIRLVRRIAGVRIFQLDGHRQTVGEPELLGVDATEHAAKITADAVLDTEGHPGGR